MNIILDMDWLYDYYVTIDSTNWVVNFSFLMSHF